MVDAFCPLHGNQVGLEDEVVVRIPLGVTGRSSSPIELQHFPAGALAPRSAEQQARITEMLKYIDTQEVEQRLLDSAAGQWVGLCFDPYAPKKTDDPLPPPQERRIKLTDEDL